MTERFHYFRRYKISGVRRVIMYGVPSYGHFYSELLNLLAPDHPRSLALFTRYDALALERILGSKRAAKVLSSGKDVHMFC